MELLKNIFYNETEIRLRAGIRLLLVSIFFILVMFVLSLATTPIRENMQYYRLIVIPLNIVFFSFFMWISARIIDQRKLSGYGFFLSREWIYDFIFGLLLGIFLISFVFIVEYLLGWITIKDYYFVTGNQNFILTIIESVLLYTYVGYYEEAISRGILIKNISEGLYFKKTGPQLAIIFAVLFTSFLFGLGHADNPNATFIGWWNIIIIGVLFGYTFVLTKSLAIPVGIHITWNFFQGCVYGFPVSGNPCRVSFLLIEQGGNPLWTGGDFGPEAGLVIYFVAVIWLILLHIWIRKRKRPVTVDNGFVQYVSDTSG